uniref:Uncharacterized protein LOC111114221 n=1 Tax=Crassostrea virginica TaxID=6565 RepID=A0A8B8BXU9_CRAVI|nr:uncharacterized protein LOC111114221 [Crassostrea virginica]
MREVKTKPKIFEYPFEVVTAANEARYSEQGKIPSLIEHSIISDIEMEDGAIRVMERKCLLEIPSLMKKFSKEVSKHAEFIQKNTMDRRSRTLVIESHNTNFTDRISIKETCTFSVAPGHSEWTQFEQHVTFKLQASKIPGLVVGKIENIVMDKYRASSDKSVKAINNIIKEGIEPFPTWHPRDIATTIETSHGIELRTLNETESERENPSIPEYQPATVSSIQLDLQPENTREPAGNTRFQELEYERRSFTVLQAWSYGLCGCFSNKTLSLITCFAPCFTAGKNAEGVGNSRIGATLSYILFPPIGIYLAARTREDIRDENNIELQAYLLKHGSLVQRSVRLLQQLFPLSGHLHCAMLYCGKKCSGGRKQHGRHVIVLPTDRPCRNVPGRQSTSENPRAERN